MLHVGAANCFLSRFFSGQLRGTNLEFPRCTVQPYIETSRWEVPQNAKHQKDQKDMHQMRPWKRGHGSYLFDPPVSMASTLQIQMLPSQKGDHFGNVQGGGNRLRLSDCEVHFAWPCHRKTDFKEGVFRRQK